MQLLRDIPLDSRLDLDILAKETTGLSGSDLKELCRQAAGAPVKEQMRRLKGKTPAELEHMAKEVRHARAAQKATANGSPWV